MRAVNLLPQDLARTRKPVNRVALAGVAGGAAVSMLLGALYLNAHASVTDRELELSAAQAELAAIPKPKVQSSGDEQLALERSGRVTAVTKALGSRVGWDRLFRELSSVLPGDVWLTDLQAQVPKPVAVEAAGATDISNAATAPAASEAVPVAPFTIQGYTYTQEGVARFLARLAVVPDLKDVELESSKKSPLAGQDVFQFAITAQIRPTGATS
jgi:Tfp pilus assembly protein PilN